MKLSVIIPAYNCANTISRTLDSIFTVNSEEIEVVVVNDGSMDSTHDVLEEYKVHFPNLIIVNQENRGLSCARNAGFTSSSGEWVMFLDGDDYLIEEGLNHVLHDLDSDHEVVLYPFMLSNNQGNLHATRYKASSYYGQPNITIPSRELRKIMLGEASDCDPEALKRLSFCSFNSSCSRIMRSAFLKRNFPEKDGYGNTELFYQSVTSMGEDRFFNIRLWTVMEERNVELSSNALYFYDIGEGKAAIHLTPSILDHLIPRREVIFKNMQGKWLNKDEANRLLSKDVWEYFLSTLRLKGNDAKEVESRWLHLINDEGLGSYFMMLPTQSALTKIKYVIAGNLVRSGRPSVAMKIVRLLP